MRRVFAHRTGRLPRTGKTKRESEVVRAIHRSGTQGTGPGSGGSASPEPQLHRDRAHPARPYSRGRGTRGQGARVTWHLARGRAREGRGDDRACRIGPDRLPAVHAPSEEGARAVAARGAPARPQLHRHRAHAAGPRPRGRGRRRPGPQSLGADLSRVRQQVIQLLSGYQGREGAAAAPGGASPPRARPDRPCSTSSGAT
jgi:hypothetical protein